MRPVDPIMLPLVSQRIMAGMSQVYVASRIGVGQATMSNIEAGVERASYGILTRYADLFDMDVEIRFIKREPEPAAKLPVLDTP
jgi:transcriptional regulator with XRE-family HTH domain